MPYAPVYRGAYHFCNVKCQINIKKTLDKSGRILYYISNKKYCSRLDRAGQQTLRFFMRSE